MSKKRHLPFSEFLLCARWVLVTGLQSSDDLGDRSLPRQRDRTAGRREQAGNPDTVFTGTLSLAGGKDPAHVGPTRQDRLCGRTRTSGAQRLRSTRPCRRLELGLPSLQHVRNGSSAIESAVHGVLRRLPQLTHTASSHAAGRDVGKRTFAGCLVPRSVCWHGDTGDWCVGRTLCSGTQRCVSGTHRTHAWGPGAEDRGQPPRVARVRGPSPRRSPGRRPKLCGAGDARQ